MTDVRVDRNRVLVSEENLLFIRPIRINWSLKSCKPNTRMYPFFDKQDVSIYVQQTGKQPGDPIVTDSLGNATGIFDIPGKTFRTGDRELVFSESSDHYGLIDLEGIIFGYSLANFTSNGIKRIFQTTETRTTIVTQEQVVTQTYYDYNYIGEIIYIPPPPPPPPAGYCDPIAQTFSTFGVEGGCFLHSIDLYFRSKSQTVPIDISIVQTKYGLPSNDPNDFIARKIFPAANVLTSTDASVPTRITFDDLVYLEQDKEYAFIILANTNEYYLFSSYLGEKSFETGLKIFEQPYLGSIFKSQNNNTWTPVQEEDLKFSINICEFDTNVNATVSLKALSPDLMIESNKFVTVSGSNEITFNSIHKHGLELGNKFELVVPNGTYNGISKENLTGTFTVSSIIDEYRFKFLAAANATSSGEIRNGGVVRYVTVLNPGNNYDVNNPPTISFVGGGGSGAAGEPVISGGKLIGIRLTNQGSGYTTEPAVVITSAVGGGAEAVCSLRTLFTYSTNTVFHDILPALSMFSPERTNYTGEINFKLASYQDSGVTQYSAAKPVNFELFKKISIGQHGLIANTSNENTYLGGNPSGTLNLTLSTENKNVSPVLKSDALKLWAYENIVNNQLDEDITSASNSELNPSNGSALGRYITKPQRLLTVNTGVRFICNLYSNENTSVDVYFRGSQSASSKAHEDHDWILMKCDTERNKSKNRSQFFDYTFYLDKVEGGFDVYQYKIVLRSKFPWEVPIVNNYRSIILL